MNCGSAKTHVSKLKRQRTLLFLLNYHLNIVHNKRSCVDTTLAFTWNNTIPYQIMPTIINARKYIVLITYFRSSHRHSRGCQSWCSRQTI